MSRTLISKSFIIALIITQCNAYPVQKEEDCNVFNKDGVSLCEKERNNKELGLEKNRTAMASASGYGGSTTETKDSGGRLKAATEHSQYDDLATSFSSVPCFVWILLGVGIGVIVEALICHRGGTSTIQVLNSFNRVKKTRKPNPRIDHQPKRLSVSRSPLSAKKKRRNCP